MSLLADDRLPQGAVGLAPGILHPAKIRAQAGGEVEHLANALHRLRFVQHVDVPGLRLLQLMLQVADATPQAGDTASRTGVQAGFQVLDLALDHRKP
ncbi:hypothetical protein D3C80_1838090 [compost metagenome]